MQRVLTVKEMQNADDYTINTLGIPSSELVLRAGTQVAEVILKRFKGGRVLVCIGKGNNGKDGEVVANILSKKHGFSVATINVSNGIFKLFDKKFDIIVDCIFGTGLNKTVEGKYKDAIDKINQSGAFIVSCDIPSGLSGDTGMPLGVAVKANLTVAIGELKLGHVLNDGPDYSGEVIVKDVGISVWEESFRYILDNKDVNRFFIKRIKNTNKGDYGRTAIIGGSKSFPGSVILSLTALTSLKAGAGYSALCVPESIYQVVAGNVPECTMNVLSSDGDGIVFKEEEFIKLLSLDALAIGMGMGVSEQTYKAVKYLLENYSGKLVIDADGLNSLSKFGVEILKNKKCEVVLTPHVKEFSRLVNIEKELILEDQITYAKNFAIEYGVTVVLKNAVSVITDGEKVVINTTGSPAMAKGGSGDVLSGFIVGLLGREQDAFMVASASCYVFGKAGEIAVKYSNEYSVVATDLIKCLPSAINSLNK